MVMILLMNRLVHVDPIVAIFSSWSAFSYRCACCGRHFTSSQSRQHSQHQNHDHRREYPVQCAVIQQQQHLVEQRMNSTASTKTRKPEFSSKTGKLKSFTQ